jgi:LysM repeat protein
MTERGLPSADASPACPFIAFEDDRDERADRPDHRHRCYAEAEPAPRAIAHQEAYCLSSAFPVCPVFQEWARREAARARTGDPTPAVAPPAPVPIAPPPGDPGDPDSPVRAEAPGMADEWDPRNRPADPPPPIESTPRRNPPRDWAAPPPWAGGVGGARGNRGVGSDPRGAGAESRNPGVDGPEPGFRSPRTEPGQGLAGSAADRLAQGEPATPDPTEEPGPPDPPPPTRAERSMGPDWDLAGLVQRPPDDDADDEIGPAVRSRATGWGSGAGDLGRADPDDRLAREREAERAADAEAFARSVGSYPAGRAGKRLTVSSTRGKDADRGKEPERRERERVQGEAPSWERARRYEAYPTIKSRAAGLPGLPGLPRVALLAGALALAAIAVFFLPALFGVGGDDPGASPTPAGSVAAPTPTPQPTPTPAPTPRTYIIQEGDTLSGIAREYGLTLEELLAANTETIEDPDRISVGDEIIIPAPPPEEVEGGGDPSAEPSAEE